MLTQVEATAEISHQGRLVPVHSSIRLPVCTPR